MDKSYRLHANISQDQVLNVNMRQDFDFLEVLSLKLSQEDSYRLHSSAYGVIIGRVLANEAFGIPNAKVSVFIAKNGDDTSDMENLYSYATVTSKGKDGVRYNLLPDYSDDECYRVVGTLPSKTLVLDDNTQLEVFEKYYRYTTVTNQAGDYMIFGIPTGTNEIHVDIDLSDIGILSQKPRDLEYKGYNINLFDNANQFRESKSLDSLAQIISQNKTVNVYPFWCDEDEGIAAITRCDIEVQYKFEPTCVFMGSIMTDNGSNTIGHDCRPAKKNGMNSQLVTGEGTIEMIRKTPDNLVEEFQIQGNQLIDSDGVWCYQIPMNLDFIGTDEYGNVVPTDNPSKGIPTRAQVRFRISKNEAPGGSSFHTAKMLVPMNPQFNEKEIVPEITMDGSEVERMYEFGSSTPQWCFRDLYWNNVYSVKSYIPRIQNRVRIPISDYSALKGSNLADDQNQIPFNKLRVDVPFTYMIICILFTIVMYIVYIINTLICAIDAILKIFFKIIDVRIFGIRPFGWIRDLLGLDYIGCIPLSAGMNDGNVAYYPGCSCTSTGLKEADCPDDMGNKCKKSDSKSDLEDQIQRSLALEYDIIKLDFYNDWLNGALYMPLWYWKKSRKKKFLFFTIKSAQDTFCNCNKVYERLRNAMSCVIEYNSIGMQTDKASVKEGESKWHKRPGAVVFHHGLIKEVKNKDDLSVYYYSAVDATDDAKDSTMQMSERVGAFPAVRLYATDIILLGNLDSENIYGLPQFFRELPSTTANIPPIATTEELNEESDGYDEDSNLRNDDADMEGIITTTGMDWGHNGDGFSPRYKSGLFMDLACTYVKTKAKACINAERLSEYGMNLDMSYSMPYASTSDLKYGDILPDGFVNKLEMDSLDGRAAFATMNHVGFIPTDYTETITQVEDNRTNYLVPKMRYLYPVDLDGRMNHIMEEYENGFEQSLHDYTDEAYLTFRFGSASNSNTPDVDNRLKHYYLTKSHFGASNPRYSMPLYNNSFYFFFGINKGNTAIDKFNKLFDAQCFQNKKIPFSVLIDTQSMAYCTGAYGTNYDGAYPYIKVKFEDIQKTYSYTLYNSFGKVIVSEDGMDMDEFVIGGFIEDGDVHVNTGGTASNPIYSVIRYQMTGEDVGDGTVVLGNQTYKLVVTDVNGKSVTERINLSQQPITFGYSSENLGVKFYDTVKTDKNYVCDNGFNGNITIDVVTIDGYQCTLSGVSTGITIADSVLTITGIKAIPKDSGMSATTLFDLTLSIKSDSDYGIDECICDNGITFIDGVLSICIYIPATYSVTVTQLCDGVESDNVSSSSIAIANGKNFHAYINKMPVTFMVGNGVGQEAIRRNNFYSTGGVETEINDQSIKGWLHPDDEAMYQYPKVNEDNAEYWGDFVMLPSTIDDVKTKRDIIAKKFEWMWSLSDGVYLTSDSIANFTYTAEGGKAPILYRTVHPDYSEYHSDETIYSKYLNEDRGRVSCNPSMPSIIGDNYNRMIYRDASLPTDVWANPYGMCFNHVLYGDEGEAFYSTDKTGVYMAAFTHDGGYSSRTGIDTSVRFLSEPWLAKPNYSQDSPKQKGRTVSSTMDDDAMIGYVTEQGHSYLRCLTVDRRFDYDLFVLGPMGYKNTSNDWEKGRMVGFTYNGIEMSYDSSTYNIISAVTHAGTSPEGDSYISSVTSNNTLEYTYEYSETNDIVKTQLNKAPTVKRRPFETTVNQYNLLNPPTGSGVIRYKQLALNGDTTKVDYAQGMYPTVRMMDVELPNASQYIFTNIACSYNVIPSIEEDNTITAYADEGETTEINLLFSNRIYFVPEKGNKEYYCLAFNRNINRDGTVISATTIDDTRIRFSVSKPDTDEFDVYIRYPKIFIVSKKNDSSFNSMRGLLNKVKLWGNAFSADSQAGDVISKVKNNLTGSSRNITRDDVFPIEDNDHTGKDVENSLMYKFYRQITEYLDNSDYSYEADAEDSYFPEGSEPGTLEDDDPKLRRDDRHNDFWLDENFVWDVENGEIAEAGNQKFSDTIFGFGVNSNHFYKWLDAKNAKTFCVVLDEAWVYTDNDGLKKTLRVVERSETYDVTPFTLTVNGCTFSSTEYVLSFVVSGDNEALHDASGMKTKIYICGEPDDENVADEFVVNGSVTQEGTNKIRLTYKIDIAKYHYDLRSDEWTGGSTKDDHKYMTVMITSPSGFIYAMDVLCPKKSPSGSQIYLRFDNQG